MQFTTILASTVLAFASGIAAIPTPFANVTLQLSNDAKGTNSVATVPADGVPRLLSDCFAGTAIGNAGFVATSALLTQFADNTKCKLVNPRMNNWVIKLDGRAQNFVDLDNDPTKAVPVFVGDFTFQCSS